MFISYRHVQPDQDLATRLHSHLRSNGVETFLDRDIPWGALWDEMVAAHLAAAEYFVILLSEHSVLSAMVREEVHRAHEQHKAGMTRILPIWIGAPHGLPYDLAVYLNLLQYVRWDAADGFDGICARLLGAVTTGDPLPEFGSPKAAILPSNPALMIESGAVRVDSHYYIRRRADLILEEQLSLGVGRTLVVRGPRQSGKSSLLVRAQAEAARLGHATFYVDFQEIEDASLKDLGTLLRHLATTLHEQLETAVQVDNVWDSNLGAKGSLRKFIERAVLGSGRSVSFILDEVDRVFSQPYRKDFFAELRSWHNRRARSSAWENLNLVLGHSTDPSRWIDGNDQSPFNVADEALWLDDFTTAELEELNSRYARPLEGMAELQRVFGGHPYLVRLALYTVKKEGIPVSEVAELALQPRSPFSGHLRHHLATLQRTSALAGAVRLILSGDDCQDEAAFQQLYSAGLVTGTNRRDARIRCELYARYLREHL